MPGKTNLHNIGWAMTYYPLLVIVEKKLPVVVLIMFYFHLYLGKIPILANIFQMG